MCTFETSIWKLPYITETIAKYTEHSVAELRQSDFDLQPVPLKSYPRDDPLSEFTTTINIQVNKEINSHNKYFFKKIKAASDSWKKRLWDEKAPELLNFSVSDLRSIIRFREALRENETIISRMHQIACFRLELLERPHVVFLSTFPPGLARAMIVRVDVPAPILSDSIRIWQIRLDQLNEMIEKTAQSIDSDLKERNEYEGLIKKALEIHPCSKRVARGIHSHHFSTEAILQTFRQEFQTGETRIAIRRARQLAMQKKRGCCAKVCATISRLFNNCCKCSPCCCKPKVKIAERTHYEISHISESPTPSPTPTGRYSSAMQSEKKIAWAIVVNNAS